MARGSRSMRTAVGALVVLAASLLALALPWARDVNVHEALGLAALSLYLVAGTAMFVLVVATFALGAEWISGRRL